MPAYLFSNEFTFDYTSNKPYNLRYPLDAFHKMTKIFKGKNDDDYVNQYTSLLFFRIAPFHPKTIRRLENSNPENDLLKIFTPLGGWLFIVKGKGIFTCKGEDVMMFSWFYPYFKNVFLKGTAIELDTTFKVLKPLKTVIPQLIIKNTGVPLCLLAGPSESTNLYSLFYESIRKIDINLFQKCLNMNYITDEHKCFISLKRKYNIVIYNCFAHLIRSVGASSPLGWLLKDILFTASKEEYERKLDQFKYTLIDTYNTFHCKDDSKDDKRYIKVGKILGVNVIGQPIEIEKSYTPLFERIERKTPTTTNFAESFHQKINSVAGNQHLNICSRLTLLANQILTRLTNIGQSSVSNLRFYINSLKKKANEKVSNGTGSAQSYSKENCSCSRSKYYSMMYDIDLPCIHMILNPKWDDISDLINEEFKNAQSFDLSLPKQGLSFDYLDTIQIDEENEEEEESSDISDSIIFECVKDDLEEYDTPIRYFIFHTYNQVKDYLKVDPIKVAETVIEVQKELLNTVEGRDLMQNDEQHYNAIWQVKTWERLNKLRK